MIKLLALFALPLLPFASPIPATSPNFRTLSPASDQATIINRCNYPIYVFSHGPGGNPIHPSPQSIGPNQYWADQLHYFSDGGVSLKISKKNTVAAPIMQLEYRVTPDGSYKGDYYDISLLNCLQGKDHKDGSLCPGYEGGLQAVCASGGSFQCKPGEYCNTQAYFVPEFDYKPGAPVNKCERGAGIAFELCASI